MLIVESEVLMEGTNDLKVCFKVTEKVLRTLFNYLYLQRVILEDVILKPNIVIPGLSCSAQANIAEVADATIQCLRQSVPAAIGGIAFLSGGQSGELASAHLNAMHVRYESKLP